MDASACPTHSALNDIEGAHYDACPLGHDKLDTTARYTRVATGMIASIKSPLDLLKARVGAPIQSASACVCAPHRASTPIRSPKLRDPGRAKGWRCF